MPGWGWALIAAGVIIVVALVVWQAMTAKRTRTLQQRFGPEYDRVVEDAPSRREAEAELRERQARREEFDIRPLPQASRDRYLRSWEAALGELPGARIRRLEQELDFATAEGLVTTGRDALYEATTGDRRAVANVVMNQLAGAGIDPASVDPAELAKLVEARERIPRKAFDEAIARAGDPGFSAEPYLARETVTDTAELGPLVDRILAANPGQVEQYRGGKQGLLGFFVGQVMKETGGSADARVVSELVRAKLG